MLDKRGSVMRRYWLMAAALPLLLGGKPMDIAAPLAAAPFDSLDPIPARSLAVMTYNVGALPWPVARGRADAAHAIAARLSILRARKAAPHIIVVQEAFIAEAQQIGRAAGYRHAAFGPDASARRATRLDGDFRAERSLLKGEATAPALPSGLAVFSDYPILSVARASFSQDVCAGYDCLANKGVLMVRVAVPNVKRPVEIITTHLNSAKRSGTPEAHNLYAFARQLDELDRFMAREQTPGAIRIFAGDFNVGHSRRRLALLTRHVTRWNLVPVSAMGRAKYEVKCGSADGACTGLLPLPNNVPLIHATDWQFVAADRRATAIPLGQRVPFAITANGPALSDHNGYSVIYRLTSG